MACLQGNLGNRVDCCRLVVKLGGIGRGRGFWVKFFCVLIWHLGVVGLFYAVSLAGVRHYCLSEPAAIVISDDY